MIELALTLALSAADPRGAQASPPDPRYDVGPKIKKRPSNDDLLEVLPTKAVEDDVDGAAALVCVVTAAGTLRNCKVVEEDPPGYGFGAALVLLAQRLQMTPALKDGRPVEGEYKFRVVWKDLENMEGRGRGRLLTAPAWFEAPTHSDVAAAMPETARGAALMRCRVVPETGRLDDCDPAGDSRGPLYRAAVKLAPKFRTSRYAPAMARKIGGLWVEVPVLFKDDLQTLELGRLAMRAEEGTFKPVAFPSAAKAAGVARGRAVVDCLVAANGRLEDCKVESATPPGVGFAETAALALESLAVSAWTTDGRPTDGRRVDLPLGFHDDAGDAAADGQAGDGERAGGTGA